MGYYSQTDPTSSSASPKQIRVLIVWVCINDRAVQEHDFQTHDIVHGDAVSICLKGDAAAEEETTDADRGSTGSEKRPSCPIESVVYVPGIISTTDSQNRPSVIGTLRGADIGRGSEFGYAEVVTNPMSEP